MLGKCFGVICSVSVIFAIFCGRTKEVCSAIISGASKSVTLTISLIGIMALWNGVMRVLSDCGAISKLSRLMRPVLKFIFPSSFKNNIATEEITSCISANLLGMANATTPLAIKAIEKMQEGRGDGGADKTKEKTWANRTAGTRATGNAKAKVTMWGTARKAEAGNTAEVRACETTGKVSANATVEMSARGTPRKAEANNTAEVRARGMSEKADDANAAYETDTASCVASADMITLVILGCASFNLVPSTIIALRQAAGAAITYQIIFPVWICSGCCALLGIVLSRICAKIYGKN